MAQVEPQALSDSLRAQVLHLVLSSTHFGRLSSFDRAKLERDLALVQKTDAGASFEIRSLVAQLDGDVDAAELYASKALKLNEPHAQGSQLYACANLGYASRGLNLARETLSAGSANLSQRFAGAVAVGGVTTVTKVVEQATEMSQGLAMIGNDAIDIARAADKALSAAGISEDFVAAVLDVAGEVQREHSLFWLDPMPMVVALTGDESEDSAPGVHYYFRVGVTPEEAVSMNRDLGERIVERGLARTGVTAAFVGSSIESPIEA